MKIQGLKIELNSYHIILISEHSVPKNYVRVYNHPYKKWNLRLYETTTQTTRTD